MKLLIVTHSLGYGGVPKTVSTLSQEWAKCHEVIIACLDSDTSDPPFDYAGRVVYLRTPATNSYIGKIYNLVMRSARLLRLIRRERPHQIISFSEMSNIPAIFASALAGRLSRLSISTHDDPATFPLWYRLCMFSIYRLPARWIAVSEGARQHSASISGLPLEKISFIPNAIPVKNLQDVARETTPPLPGRYILGVGRLAPQKGFDRLLRAFHVLDRPDLDLVILGDGPEKESLLRLARELGIESRLHLPGFLPDTKAWCRHSVCFVLSSRHEGWPLVLMEALVNECAIVSFTCDFGPSEILEDGKYGLLVPEGDIKALAEAVARVLDDDVFRRRLAVGGPERAKMFSAAKIAPRWIREE